MVACENGEAPSEALRAQAIAARSYLYYELLQHGVIEDGIEDQVYTCAKSPDERHFDAVRSTASEVLSYEGQQVAAFYVAGAIPSTTTCRPLSRDPDTFETERYVTYNQGRRGSEVEQSRIGWVDPDNWANRGCMSQNGAACLAARENGYAEILEFYYGADIVREFAPGPCTDASATGCRLHSTRETVIDEQTACFSQNCETRRGWSGTPIGDGGHSFRLTRSLRTDASLRSDSSLRMDPSLRADPSLRMDRSPRAHPSLRMDPSPRVDPNGVARACEAIWSVEPTRAGLHLLEIHVPHVPQVLAEPAASRATYEIWHRGRVDSVTIDQRAREGWIVLGEFFFRSGRDQSVRLVVSPDEPSDGALAFDALRVTPVIDDRPGSGPSGPAGRGRPWFERPDVPWAIAALAIGVAYGLWGARTLNA